MQPISVDGAGMNTGVNQARSPKALEAPAIVKRFRWGRITALALACALWAVIIIVAVAIAR